MAMNNEPSAWASFLDARLLLIHEWLDEGKTHEQITDELNHHDVGQIRLLAMTDARKPMPASMRQHRDRYRTLLELMTVAYAYGERSIDKTEMQHRVADIIEGMP